MRVGKSSLKSVLLVCGIMVSAVVFGHPINDYYKEHKNDSGMESQVVPPKLAALMIDEDYPEAIDVLKSLSALKYLNFSGDKERIKNYATKALSSQGDYDLLLEEKDRRGKLSVFGKKKKGTVRKLFVVVQTKSEFLLLIGKGKLTDDQIEVLPELAKEI